MLLLYNPYLLHSLVLLVLLRLVQHWAASTFFISNL